MLTTTILPNIDSVGPATNTSTRKQKRSATTKSITFIMKLQNTLPRFKNEPSPNLTVR